MELVGGKAEVDPAGGSLRLHHIRQRRHDQGVLLAQDLDILRPLPLGPVVLDEPVPRLREVYRSDDLVEGSKGQGQRPQRVFDRDDPLEDCRIRWEIRGLRPREFLPEAIQALDQAMDRALPPRLRTAAQACPQLSCAQPSAGFA